MLARFGVCMCSGFQLLSLLERKQPNYHPYLCSLPRARVSLAASAEGSAMLIHCPVCPNTIAEQILSQYKVSVRKEKESEIGALATYRCTAGHIFFVRVADVFAPTLVAESYELPFGKH